MWPLSLLSYIVFPPTFAFFFRTKWSMIYMKYFTIQHMTCFPMLSLSLPMTWLHLSYPIYIIWIFVCHVFLSGPNDLLWWNFSMHMLFSRNKYSTWIKWLPWMKWCFYMIWLSLFLCTWFFFRNQHATWIIWLYCVQLWYEHLSLLHFFPKKILKSIKTNA